MKEKHKGGRGHEYEARNRALVMLRKLDPQYFSFAVLGEVLHINKSRVHQLYEDHKDKYHV